MVVRIGMLMVDQMGTTMGRVRPTLTLERGCQITQIVDRNDLFLNHDS